MSRATISQAATDLARRLPKRVAPLVAGAAILVGLSVVGGVVAAALGGKFETLGAGPGGLWGLPSLGLMVIAISLLPASVIYAVQNRRSLGSGLRFVLLLAGGAWIVAMGFFIIAHALDPCLNGWWDLNSRIGSQRLCERYGDELNWHPRFHLLAHSVPTTALLLLYLGALRRWVLSAMNTRARTNAREHA